MVSRRRSPVAAQLLAALAIIMLLFQKSRLCLQPDGGYVEGVRVAAVGDLPNPVPYPATHSLPYKKATTLMAIMVDNKSFLILQSCIDTRVNTCYAVIVRREIE